MLRSVRPFIFLLLIVPLLTSAGVKKKHLVGYWEVYKVERNGKSADVDREKFIYFRADRTMVGGRVSSGKIKHEGTWTFNKKEKTLELKSNDGNKDDGAYKVVKLTKTELSISNDRVIVHMDRGQNRSFESLKRED